MRMEVVIQGFPGRSLTGALSWSSVAYVESGNAKILFDTGGPAKRSTLKARLERIGVAPERVNILVLSHFHDDHIRNYDFFPNAEIVLGAAEDEWAATNPVHEIAFPEVYYDALKKSGRMTLLDKEEEIAPGVEIMFLPGHTPGLTGLLLKGGGAPATVLASDAVKNIAELATGVAPHTLDPEASRRSIMKIRRAAEVVVPGHDRILRVEKDRIVAITEARDGIRLPRGVARPDGEEVLDLHVPKTELPIETHGC